jgi:ABC-type amino acid transport substrate-binding protein
VKHKVLAAILVGASAVLTAIPAAAAAPLRVITYETKPFFYKDASGKPAGLEYDLLVYAGKALGRPIEVAFASKFDDVLPRLLAGQADVAAATLTVTAERKAQMDFSAGYFPVRVMLVERKKEHVAKLGELAGATLATMHGTTYEKLLSEGVPGAQFTYGPDEEALMKLVTSGKARAAAMDSAVALPLLSKYPQLALGIPLSVPQELAFAVHKGDPLATSLSKTIEQLKASKIYYHLLEQHLGKEAARLVAAGKS